MAFVILYPREKGLKLRWNLLLLKNEKQYICVLFRYWKIGESHSINYNQLKPSLLTAARPHRADEIRPKTKNLDSRCYERAKG